MQAVGIIVASVLLASAASFGISYLVAPEGPAGPQPVMESADGDPRIEALERQVRELQTALSEAAAVRSAVQPVADQRIEAAVAKWMRANPAAKAAVEAAAPAESGARSAFQQLITDGIKDSEVLAIWKKARENGTADELLKMFEDQAANLPNNVQAQVAVGVAYIQRLQGMSPGPETGMLATKGDQAFDRALKLDPKNWDARYIKSMSLSFWPPAFGKQREALDHLQILRAQQESGPTQPKHAQTYVLLGNLYSQQGKTKEAQEAWQAGLGLFPDNATLKKQLGK